MHKGGAWFVFGLAIVVAQAFRVSAAVAEGECFPACRTGFVCTSAGTCVSACNPPCSAGETCTADLQCVRSGHPESNVQPGVSDAAGSAVAPAEPPTAAAGAPEPAPSPGPPPAAAFASLPPPIEAPYSPFLAIPYLGAYSYQSARDSSTGVGLRVGGIVGWRFAESWSVNGELTYDPTHFKNLPSNANVSDAQVQIDLAPLAHFTAPPVLFVAGPKLGLWYEWSNETDTETNATSVQDTFSAVGWFTGLTAGAFIPLTYSVSLGGLFSFEYGKPTSCDFSVNGTTQTCVPSDTGYKLISFSAGVQL